MASDTVAAQRRSFHANEHNTLLSEVDSVLCVLLPKAVLAAGFNADGQVVVAHFNADPATKTNWEPDFFEQQFMGETLLGVPQQIRAVFVASEHALLIPQSVFHADAARQWIQKLAAASPNEVLHHHPISQPEASYAFTLPAPMDKLLHRYFDTTPVLPLALYQHHKPTKAQCLMQCFVAEGRAYASLHQNGVLAWQQQFPCTTAEDIVWQVLGICHELHIPRVDVQMELTMASDAHFEMATELERYFPKIKWTRAAGAEDGAWAPALFLLQQLFVCAL